MGQTLPIEDISLTVVQQGLARIGTQNEETFGQSRKFVKFSDESCMSALGVRAVIKFSFDPEDEIFAELWLYAEGVEKKRCDRRSI